MLLEFSVSNFRSFRKRQTLNLSASPQDKSLPENCIDREFAGIKPRLWLKGAAIYGANASGKTTVLAALQALSRMVADSARMTDPHEEIPQIEPFALRHGESKVPTAFEVIFMAEGVRFSYCVAATRERIWHESLRAYPTKPQTWFRRDWNAASQSYQWGPERPTGFSRDPRIENDTLSNMLFLSKHIASNRTELEPVFRWFKNRLVFLNPDFNRRLDTEMTLRHLQERTPQWERILQLLSHADLGITNARAVEILPWKDLLESSKSIASQNLQKNLLKQLNARSSFHQPELIHRGAENGEFPLPWDVESAGTQQLFALAGPWLQFLAEGNVVCIDELDTSLHPLMVMQLLRLLFSHQENRHGTQIFFTTHDPLLLDTTLLRRDQIWFTEKDHDGEGHLYPLSRYAPRKEESLIRGYLSGRYGGLPFIPKGLLGQNPSYEVAAPKKTATRRKTKKPNHE